MADNFTEIPNENEDIDIVELKDETGRVLKFYHIGTIEHEERWFAFFQPAEVMEGVEGDEVYIFEIVGDEGSESLVPVEDEKLLDAVYEAFIAEMEEDECDCGCDCGCDHDHEHEHHCGCGCDHDDDDDDCGCGNH